MSINKVNTWAAIEQNSSKYPLTVSKRYQLKAKRDWDRLGLVCIQNHVNNQSNHFFIQFSHEWGFEEDIEKEISELMLLVICSLAGEIGVMFLNIKTKTQKIKSIHNLNFCFSDV